MLGFKERQKVRGQIARLADQPGVSRRDRKLLTRLVENGPLFDEWIAGERKKFEKKQAKTAVGTSAASVGAAGDGEFLKYLLDLLKESGILKILIELLLKKISP